MLHSESTDVMCCDNAGRDCVSTLLIRNCKRKAGDKSRSHLCHQESHLKHLCHTDLYRDTYTTMIISYARMQAVHACAILPGPATEDSIQYKLQYVARDVFGRASCPSKPPPPPHRNIENEITYMCEHTCQDCI